MVWELGKLGLTRDGAFDVSVFFPPDKDAGRGIAF